MTIIAMIDDMGLVNKGFSKGFTLLELQISIVILLFTFTGLAMVLMNYLKQVEWSENRQVLYTVVPDDLSKTIFTESRAGTIESGVSYRVNITSLTKAGTSLTAVVNLQEK
jgi:Tfp pilus assembly protein PilV